MSTALRKPSSANRLDDARSSLLLMLRSDFGLPAAALADPAVAARRAPTTS